MRHNKSFDYVLMVQNIFINMIFKYTNSKYVYYLNNNKFLNINQSKYNMDNQNFNINYANKPGLAKPVERTFLANVFLWMAAALAITGITAYVFGTNAGYMNYLVNVGADGRTAMTGLGWIVTIAPLAFVLLLGE